MSALDSKAGVVAGQLRRRRFDHDDAIRRWQAGETFKALAREYGVWPQAVQYAVKRATDPEWKQRSNTYSRDWQRRNHKTTCSNCGREIWKHTSKTGLCRRCHGFSLAKGVRPDELLCHHCDEWKRDRDFPHQRKNIARRARHTLCRLCQTKARQDYRERHKQPCVHCGAPALPPNEKTTHGAGMPRCRSCYRAARRAA